MWMRRDLRLYSFPPCVFTFHSFLLDCITILPPIPVRLMPTSLAVCPCVQPPKQHTSRLAHIMVDIWVGWDSLCMSVWRCCILGPTHRSCEFFVDTVGAQCSAFIGAHQFAFLAFLLVISFKFGGNPRTFPHFYSNCELRSYAAH
jgi:hypothetical protein